jgi:hypothetical protein
MYPFAPVPASVLVDLVVLVSGNALAEADMHVESTPAGRQQAEGDGDVAVVGKSTLVAADAGAGNFVDEGAEGGVADVDTPVVVGGTHTHAGAGEAGEGEGTERCMRHLLLVEHTHLEV